MIQIEGMAITRGDAQQGFRVALPSLTLDKGEIGALTGLSGCGKSTLLEMIGLILRPDELSQFQLGDNLSITQAVLGNEQAQLSALRAEKLGFMLQNGGLLPFLTVMQNIQLPRKMLGLSPHSDWLDHAIDHLQLRSFLNRLPRQLSIGERQRAAFIRAIAHEPALLLADEPTAALDPHNAQALYALIVEMVKQLNISALVVSHDWSLVERFGFSHYHAQLEGGGSVFIKQ
ncbi:ATP-binding component of an ABC superfamily transporter [Proteus hauseri ATCC 700826]|uniref:ATP-binding component of an ABC superfamily transporter n=1 Tax=Proteus hauseri ATCC 700826 TaxID=1354271 RepID=A0AAJ3HVG6_PROHU|nr:ABC transporter ATP-binding protein [Proteus hauseri]OAT51107.1 ATP-binding component of an ABC superfamily transporter [Proteus hauseri ATCC 700826]